MTIELIQLKQAPHPTRDALNIDLLFQIDDKCYWRHIELDSEVTTLANGQEVAPWKGLMYVVNKQLKSVEKEHFLNADTEARKLSLDVIHPDLMDTIIRLEQLVKA